MKFGYMAFHGNKDKENFVIYSNLANVFIIRNEFNCREQSRLFPTNILSIMQNSFAILQKMLAK
ncbi:MAG: hypothetical protein CVU72_00885 [Deltaproteobacteria bacterium HGW-Deltaproteobacteria-7]|nr:MAG: hypothetical protein CVU72_00885 [Deltaproteobacteria bacterium HGW-Deltaproteobacteria-7]PKN20708.1 MAG: hypothetical protein CVU71_02685 [Deltaproteobacteria bacterium HGW-Deltaproteobacteria-6]